MKIAIYETSETTADAAAAKAARELSRCIAAKGRATFMAATGASQIKFLEALARERGVDWARTTMFHLDEYVGLPASHPSSFRRYLKERFIDVVHPGTVHLIQGDVDDPEAECERLAHLLRQDPLDIAFVGIGENGHLAFNDPPADFETDEPFITVELDEQCRAQQVREGWFQTPDQVPRKAITVTIQQILKSQCIVCTVPGTRKAKAVKCALEGPVTPFCPASILQNHPSAHIFLDVASASLLERTSAASFGTNGTPQGANAISEVPKGGAEADKRHPGRTA